MAYELYNINVHGSFYDPIEYEFFSSDRTHEDTSITFQTNNSYIFFLGRLGRASADIAELDFPQTLLTQNHDEMGIVDIFKSRYSYDPRDIVKHGYVHLFCPGNTVPNQFLKYDRSNPNMAIFESKDKEIEEIPASRFTQDTKPRKVKYKNVRHHYDFSLKSVVEHIEEANPDTINVIIITNCLVVHESVKKRLENNPDEKERWIQTWKNALTNGENFISLLPEDYTDIEKKKLREDLQEIDYRTYKETGVAGIHPPEEGKDGCINDRQLKELFDEQSQQSRYFRPGAGSCTGEQLENLVDFIISRGEKDVSHRGGSKSRRHIKKRKHTRKKNLKKGTKKKALKHKHKNLKKGTKKKALKHKHKNLKKGTKRTQKHYKKN